MMMIIKKFNCALAILGAVVAANSVDAGGTTTAPALLRAGVGTVLSGNDNTAGGT